MSDDAAARDSQLHHPDGHRADPPRRARLRHLLAPAQGPHHLPRHRRSTMTSPTSSSRSCCSSRARIRTRTSCSTSTRRAAWSRRAWRSTTPCSTCGRDVATICMGQAASMGAFLLAAGAKGKRFALPHSRIMIHQPLGGFQGQATDIDIHAKEILRTRDKLNELLVKHTGQPIERIERDTERDYFMSAERGQGVRPHRRRARAEAQAPRAGKTVRVARGLSCTRSCATLSQCRPSASATTTATSPAPSAARARRRSRSSSPGPTVYICDECIGLCNDIIAEEIEKEDAELRPGPGPEAGRDQDGPRRVRDRAGAREEDPRGRGPQPLQAHRRQGRRPTTSSCRSRTSCCSAPPAAARRCSRRRWRASSTCRSPSPTPPP